MIGKEHEMGTEQEMRDQLVIAARTLAHAVGTESMPYGAALQTLLVDRRHSGFRKALHAFWTVIRDEYPEKDFDVTLADFCSDKPEAIGDASATPSETQS